MTQQIISTGITPNDHGGDTLRVAGEKINSNFTDFLQMRQPKPKVGFLRHI